MEDQDRVRKVTPESVIEELDHDARQRVQSYEGVAATELTARIRELETEWDIERVLAANASTLALTGVLLGATVSRRFLAIPAVVLPFLLQHALHGWCPPLPLFRTLGVRTRKEIAREKYALKTLRGDFVDAESSAVRAWSSADR
jgi:hypothetical protein